MSWRDCGDGEQVRTLDTPGVGVVMIDVWV